MQKRYDEMDILRGISIIAVMLIHISSEVFNYVDEGIVYSIALFINQGTRFAVPAFLMLSGWGLTSSQKYNQKYLYFLKSQLSKILIPYIIWTAIYYAWSINIFSTYGFIRSIVLGAGYYHLYYVPIIIFFYLVYPILYKVSKSFNGLLLILFITILSQIADKITGMEIFNMSINVFNWIFFFAFGIWFAVDFESKILKVKKHIKLVSIICLTAITLVFVESYVNYHVIGKVLATTSMRPSIIISSVLCVLVGSTISCKNKFIKRFFINLANASYGVYLSHALILTFYKMLLIKLGISIGSIEFMLSALLIVMPISWVISIAMDKLEKIIKKYLGKLKLAYLS